MKTTDYIGNFIYKQGELAYILNEEGRIVSQGDGEWEYQYFLNDHLGNTRIAFNDKYKILQDKSYYPFGMLERSVNPATAGQIDGLSVAGDFTPDNKYLYNGKEMQDDFELDWPRFQRDCLSLRIGFTKVRQSQAPGEYDYGARFYDPQLGRWHVTDAMAEKSPAWTPYRYGFNNPVSVNDPNGNLERHQIIDPHLDGNNSDDNYYSSVTVTGIGGTGKTTIAANASTSNPKEDDNNEGGDDDNKAKMEGDEPSTLQKIADYTILFNIDFIGGGYDFVKNYFIMRNWKKSDKYFHSRANFQATKRGPGGAFFAKHFSNLREIYDQRVKGNTKIQSLKDQKANIYGRIKGRNYRYYEGPLDSFYEEIIPKYRPKYKLFPDKY